MHITSLYLLLVLLLTNMRSVEAMVDPLPAKLGTLKTNLSGLNNRLQNLNDKLQLLANKVVHETDPLSEKLNSLKTHLEVLGEKLEDFRDVFQDLKQDLETESSFFEDEDTIFINAYIKLIFLAKKEPTPKGWLNALWSYIPSLSNQQSPLTPATSTSNQPKQILEFEIKGPSSSKDKPYMVQLERPGLSTQEMIALQNALTTLEFKQLLISADEMKNRLKKIGVQADTAEEGIAKITAAWQKSGTSESYAHYFYRTIYGPEVLAEIDKLPRYLVVNNKKFLKGIAAEFKKKNRDTRKGPDKELAQHYWNRLNALNKTIKNCGKRFDYSKKIKHYPEFMDPYGGVFTHCYGSFIDKQLHEELCETRTTMLELQEKYPARMDVQSYGPIVNRVTAVAKREHNIVNAFNLSDFARDVVFIASKVAENIITDAKHLVDPRSWINMAVGVFKLGMMLADEEIALEDLNKASYASMFSGNSDPLLNASAEYKERCDKQALQAQLAYDAIKEKVAQMSWQEVTASGTTVIVQLFSPLIVTKGYLLAASFSGRELVGNLAKVLKSSFAPECLGEAAGIGKIAMEEGIEIAQMAIEVVKKNPLIGEKGKSVAQTAKNAAQLAGEKYEKFLVEKFGGKGSFKVTNFRGTREFDGAVGNLWYEAKSGQFWDTLLSNQKIHNKFQSDMAKGLKIAQDHGATYKLFSQTPIPQTIKDWLTKQGISFSEIPLL